MVRTRSGNEVFHTETSYGRAARTESTRRRRKRKVENDQIANVATPRNTRSHTRTMIEIDESLATPPSSLVRAGPTPSPKAERLLRTTRKPRCSDYGMARHYAFKGRGYFFCNPCDLWDALLPDTNQKSSIRSRRYACTAEHTHFSHPTTLRKQDCYSRRRKRTVGINAGAIAPAGLFSVEDDKCFSGDEQEVSSESDSCLLLDTSSSVRSLTTQDNRDNRSGISVQSRALVGDAASSCNHSTCTSLECTSTAAGADDRQGDIVQPPNHDVAGTTTAVSISHIPTTATATATTLDESSLVARIQILEGKIALLQQRNKLLLKEIQKINGPETSSGRDVQEGNTSNRSTSIDNAAFTLQVLGAINGVAGWKKYRRWGKKRVGALISKAIFTDAAYIPHLLVLAREHFREKVFTPFNILREMDLAGGTLSYEGIEVLRRVDSQGLKGFRGSMIPSTSALKRMAGVVEWYAQEQCPFKLQQTTKGESVQFVYAKSMLCVLKAFHLDAIGKSRSLSIASSIDGASLSKNLSIIAGGIKITDRGARCPVTNRPLLDNPSTMSAQSRNLCIPFKIMMGRETKETFADFGSLFKFLDSLSEEATLPIELAGFLPFSCMTNCDLSAQWKGLCKGGAAKVHTLPCTGCATESDLLATPNARPCIRWCTEHSATDPEWMCYHKPMASPERVATMQAEVAELVSTLERALVEINEESRITHFDVELDNPPEASFKDNMSIHFLPDTATQRQAFSCLLSNELILRGHDVNGNLDTRRERLRIALKDEATLSRLSKEIAHGEVKEGAYFLLMHTLPCVLHMENRNGIKILSMLLVEGISNAKKKLSYTGINAEGIRVSRFISDAEDLINRSILGTNFDPCQWMCPFDSKKKELGPITMDNVRTRRIIDSLDILVDVCVVDDGRKASWMSALGHYRIAMVLLRKKDDFTNEEIASYQCHADKFFQVWLQLFQKEGITNYIHMIGSGHVADYLYKWKNLYRFSQQGWEAMNSLIKTFFFRRTSHGGGVRGGSKKSRLIPIARWLQRRMMFLCRVDEQVIRQYVIDNPIPHGYCTQASLPDDIYD